MSSPVGVGVIGAGTISDTYLENLSNFADTEVLAIGDIVTDAAKEKAAKYEVPAAGDVATVLDHPDIEIIVNPLSRRPTLMSRLRRSRLASTFGTRSLWPLIG